MSQVVAFTDGGCRGNPGVGAWAFLLVDVASRKALEAAGGEKLTTNNRMELGAAIAALQAIKQPKTRILVVSDSKYVIGCCTQWMAGWKAKGWPRLSILHRQAFPNCTPHPPCAKTRLPGG